MGPAVEADHARRGVPALFESLFRHPLGFRLARDPRFE